MVVYRDPEPRYFIVNPTSGGGRGKKAIEIIKDICWQNNYKCVIYETKGPGHATEIARSLKFTGKKALIYSVGGDGTLNEVINGIDFDNSFLGIISVGSGNDFYKSLKDGVRKVDLGLVNGRYFINIASLGLDAEVAKTANDIKSKYTFLSGTLAYLGGIFKAIINYRTFSINYNSIMMDISLIAICNGKQYGRICKIAPNADISDGMFDVCCVDPVNKKMKMLKELLHIIKGSHLDDECVHTTRCSRVIIKSDSPMLCNIDGEIFSDTSFEFSIIPDRLELIPIDDPFLKDINRFTRKLK